MRPVQFRLQVGDQIGISVWQEPELSTEQRVQGDGTVAPPLLGSVAVVGRTVDEVRATLTKAYLEFLKNPRVSVRVVEVHSDRAFVLGEVTTPQAVPLVGPTTLVQAITIAEGFEEEYADKTVVRLVRAGPDGQPLVQCVNVAGILAGRVPDIPLQRGDIVYVPARGVTNWARTVGQALMPLSSAIATAGGAAALYTAFN